MRFTCFFQFVIDKKVLSLRPKIKKSVFLCLNRMTFTKNDTLSHKQQLCHIPLP